LARSSKGCWTPKQNLTQSLWSVMSTRFRNTTSDTNAGLRH